MVAQTVLKWYKDAIHTNIFRNRSHIVEQEKLGRLFAVYTGKFRQARERYEKELVGPVVKQDISKVAPEEMPLRLTRSNTLPFN